MKGTYEVDSVEETWAVAREFAATIRPGDVVCLEGDLGAGKTTFTQGLAAALGAEGRVTSPTFCIVREHPCPKIPHGITGIVHMDLYRLKSADDLEAIGWEDYLSKGAVIVVEWPERAEEIIPAKAKRVVFRHPESGEISENRIITIDMEPKDLV